MTFLIRDTPIWLLTHQDWISDGARHLFSVLRTLADQRTGRLFISGRGWISPRTIERRAGIHEDTRLKYMKELKLLGAVHVHRDHVLRVIEGRKRWVWGECQITVLPLHAPNPHKQRRPSTPGNHPNAKSEPQACDSSTPGFSTPGAENPLLHPESSGPEETGSQYYQKPPNGSRGGVGSAVDEKHESGNHHHQNSPAKKTDDDKLSSIREEPEKPNRFEILQDRAKKILTKKGEDPDIVDTAIAVIDGRSSKIPSSEAYYVTSFKHLKETAEWNEIFDLVQTRKALRQRFMPDFSPHLTAEQEKKRQKFNEMHANEHAGGQIKKR